MVGDMSVCMRITWKYSKYLSRVLAPGKMISGFIKVNKNIYPQDPNLCNVMIF